MDQHDAAVVGLSVAAHQSLPLECLDQAGHRRLSQSFEFGQLGDAPWPAGERAQQAGLGARQLAAELPYEQAHEQGRVWKQLL